MDELTDQEMMDYACASRWDVRLHALGFEYYAPHQAWSGYVEKRHIWECLGRQVGNTIIQVAAVYASDNINIALIYARGSELSQHKTYAAWMYRPDMVVRKVKELIPAVEQLKRICNLSVMAKRVQKAMYGKACITTKYAFVYNDAITRG